jgi:hypothetical protein
MSSAEALARRIHLTGARRWPDLKGALRRPRIKPPAALTAEISAGSGPRRTFLGTLAAACIGPIFTECRLAEPRLIKSRLTKSRFAESRPAKRGLSTLRAVISASRPSALAAVLIPALASALKTEVLAVRPLAHASQLPFLGRLVVHTPARLFRQQNAEVDLAGLELAGSSPAQHIHFLGHQLARCAGRNVEDQRPIRHAANLFHAMADLLKHLSQLAVAAFHQNNLVPGIFPGANHADACGRRANAPLTGLALGNRYAGAQLLQRFLTRRA